MKSKQTERRDFLKKTSLASSGLFLLSPLTMMAKSLSKEEVMPMTLRLSKGVVPKRGFCSTGLEGGRLFSGNGKMRIDITGIPLSDEITLFCENLTEPPIQGVEAPKIAHALPKVRELMMDGKYKEGLKYSLDEAKRIGMSGRMYPFPDIPMLLKVNIPEDGKPYNYLRTLDYESGEMKVLWSDNRGDWERRYFASRPDDVIVQSMTGPNGKSFSSTIDIISGIRGYKNEAVGYNASYTHKSKGKRVFVIGKYKPNAGTGNECFITAVRVVNTGGEVNVNNDKIVIENAKSVILLMKTERFSDYQDALLDEMASSMDKITTEYEKLLERNRQIQSEVMNRCVVDFGGKKQFGMSSEELLISQKLQDAYEPALLEQLFDMGRYWLYAVGTGNYPAIRGHANINLNLQISSAATGAIPEAMDSWVKWLEEITPDSRENAKNIFGARGTLFHAHPDATTGVMYHFDYWWPHHYWVAGGGWLYSPVWDYYLVTGDEEFLRKHVEPGLKELAWFFEDYLILSENNGKYIFMPSYSPENNPSNVDCPVVINSVMDIAVCKEVLTHLIEASQTLGVNSKDIPKWQDMLDKMPEYLYDADGAIKEWAWESLEERQDHRHPSHLYPAWPTDEATPEETPELSKAIWLANRKRANGNSSGHGFSYRAIAATRSKDWRLVDWQLRQMLEISFFKPTLRSSHNPYTEEFMPDQTGALPTILQEMLFYSRPGVLEVLPAIPTSLKRGSIKGLLARTFAKVDMMSWDLDKKKVDLTVSSLKDQDIELFVRYGIKSITVSNNSIIQKPTGDRISCRIRLTTDQPINIQLQLGDLSPSDWVRKV